MENPFEELKRDLKEIKTMLKEKQEQPKQDQPKSEDLIRYVPVPEILQKKICSRSTLYAHAKQGHFSLYKFGNLTYVDREEFEAAFRKVTMKGLKVA